MTKMNSKMEVAIEMEEAKEIKSVIQVPAEWICEECSSWKEFPVTTSDICK